MSIILVPEIESVELVVLKKNTKIVLAWILYKTFFYNF